jgi:DNA-3-methyladenine glycosylase I
LYHDTEYGFPTSSECELFERLTLEIFQAGLSWLIVLKKREQLKRAFRYFDVNRVSRFTKSDIKLLKSDASIIRNQLKIEATVYNACVIMDFRQSHGGFSNWLMSNHPKNNGEWNALFKQNFKFTGAVVVNEFLVSTGYLPGAHSENCPIASVVSGNKPPWQNQKV